MIDDGNPGKATMDIITNFSQGTLSFKTNDEKLVKPVWETVVEAAEKYNDPGNFTAFRFNYRQSAKKIAYEMQKVERADLKLIAFFKFYKTEYPQFIEAGGCPILNTSIDFDDGNESLKKEVTKALEYWKTSLVAIVNQGIRNSELEEINAENFVFKIIAMIEGSIMMVKILNNPNILLENIKSLENEIKELTIS